MPEQALNQVIAAVHDTPPKIVIDFAGAGAQAVAWLHSVAGSSRTVLEATDRYAAASLVDLLGFEPDQFTSAAVARAMATAAYLRACQLSEASDTMAGIGCTATIATDRTKRGDHRCCVASCTAAGVITYSLTLSKGRRGRAAEEALVSTVIILAVAEVCGLEPGAISLPLVEGETLERQEIQAGLLERLLGGDFEVLTVWPDGRRIPARRSSHLAVFSGAFNPLHDGHRQLARLAAERLQRQIFFELPLVNADKAAIDSLEAERRLAQFQELAPVLLTRAPLFSEKAALFPHSVFIIGADTAARLIQPRFYQNSQAQMLAAFDQIRTAGCRFLVAGRLHDDQFLTLDDLDLPAGYRELFEQIPASQFRQDISSTELRAE